jgi:hypothetical protein
MAWGVLDALVVAELQTPADFRSAHMEPMWP